MMGTHAAMQSIVVYLIERHPLDLPAEGPNFQWLHFNNNYKRQLKEWIGPHDPEAISFLIDEEPSGDAWKQLIEGLNQGKIKRVVTHLAPLSNAQRHLLIGICAETGAQLITPSDAGRNRGDGIANP
jgi:NADPH:quinone reductase-like Zn-dependent oxidoreductase